MAPDPSDWQSDIEKEDAPPSLMDLSIPDEEDQDAEQSKSSIKKKNKVGRPRKQPTPQDVFMATREAQRNGTYEISKGSATSPVAGSSVPGAAMGVLTDKNGTRYPEIKYDPNRSATSSDEAPIIPTNAIDLPQVEVKYGEDKKPIYDPSYTVALVNWFMAWRQFTIIWNEREWYGKRASGVNRFAKTIANPPPRVEIFALRILKMKEQQFRDWGKEHEELEEALGLCDELHQAAIKDMTLLGEYNAIWSKFEAINRWGWKDKQEVDHNLDGTNLPGYQYVQQLAAMDSQQLTSAIIKQVEKAKNVAVAAERKKLEFEAQYPPSNTIDAETRSE